MSWKWISDKKPKANKEHKCILCGEKILKGEIYYLRTGSDDGIILMKMHLECEEVSSDWDEGDWESTSPYEMNRPKVFPYTYEQSFKPHQLICWSIAKHKDKFVLYVNDYEMATFKSKEDANYFEDQILKHYMKQFNIKGKIK